MNLYPARSARTARRHLLHLAPRPPVTVATPAAADAALESDALLRGAREVLIQHGGETYRLRHTRNDKLILTK